MKCLKLILTATVLICQLHVQSQVFLVQSILDEFFVEADVMTKMQQTGYRTTSLSSLPSEISTPMKKLTNYLDENLRKAKKMYFINENDGSVFLCGIENGYFAYGVNFFMGNEYAVQRIKEMFIAGDLSFDHEENGISYYMDGEDAGALVGKLENDMVMVGYFEP